MRRVPFALGTVFTAAALGVVTWLVGSIFPIGAGITAKTICSDVFVAGRDPAGAMAEEVPQASFVRYWIDEDSKTVRAAPFRIRAKTAVHRPGLGCVLTNGVDIDALRAEGFEVVRPEPSDEPWPTGAGDDPRPDPPGLDRIALDAAVDAAFEDDDPEHPLNTRAVVVVQGGRLLAERYADGFDARTPQLGWSMTKSVTSALVGILYGRGEIDVNAPVGFDAWSDAGDSRASITWDHLLRMSSGLAFNESYGMRTDVTVMLFDRRDGAAVARDKSLAHEVDSHWAYSSGTTNLLQLAIRERIDDDDAYHRFPGRWLFGPVGMRSAVMETDPSGTFVGSSFMYATPRDWARFGQLYLRDGVWEGKRILPEGWVARSVTPTPTHPSRGYGMQWWLNAAEAPEDRPFPSLPPDAYFASGHQGQMVLVVPSRDAVIVRMGMTNGRAFPRDDLARSILAALPESPRAR